MAFLIDRNVTNEYDAGLRLERIAYLLGHADIKTAVSYLGLSFDDAAEEMRTLAEYQESVELQKGETPALGQQNSGPCGIRDHETDWLTLENALPRASSPRRRIER